MNAEKTENQTALHAPSLLIFAARLGVEMASSLLAFRAFADDLAQTSLTLKEEKEKLGYVVRVANACPTHNTSPITGALNDLEKVFAEYCDAIIATDVVLKTAFSGMFERAQKANERLLNEAFDLADNN